MPRKEKEEEDEEEDDEVEATGGEDMRKRFGWIAPGRPADEGLAIVSPMADVCTTAGRSPPPGSGRPAPGSQRVFP